MTIRNHSNSPKSSLISALLLTILLVVLAILSLKVDEAPDWTRFLGRFHPIILHLPIGFLVLLVIAEIAHGFSRSSEFESSRILMVKSFAVAAVLSATLGLALGSSGEYDDELLTYHRILGCTTAVLAVWLVALRKVARLKKPHGFTWFYHGFLAIITCIITLTGFYGGSLTHGSGYLTGYMPGPLKNIFGIHEDSVVERTPVAFEEADVFEHVIHPILQDHCLGCHSQEKQKGQLRLDSYEFILAGGESGNTVVPYDPDASEIIIRTRLPDDHDDRMPPEGKPRPTHDQLILLSWWAEQGAPESGKLETFAMTGPILKRILEQIGQEDSGILTPLKPWEEIEQLLQQIAANPNIEIEPVAENSSSLIVKASRTYKEFGDDELAQLSSIGSNVVQLHLGYSQVTDTGLRYLKQMPNLESLHLQKTSITDAGLSDLKALKKLTYLNLYDTQVSDRCFDSLKSLPALRNVYLWGTNVSDAAARQFQENMVDPFQLERWQDEMKSLKSKIAASRVRVDTGPDYTPAPEPEVPKGAESDSESP